MLFRKKPNIKRPLYRRIINVFIYFGVGVIIAVMILFAISQTSTFRNWLKEKVVTTVNGSLNGALSIESLDGTIFTSLILNNTVLTQGRDTLLSAEKIEIKVSPHKLLFKIIYFRNLEIDNAKINLVKEDDGELNISRLAQSTEETVEEDTTSSGFMFKLQAANISLNNVDFTLQTRSNKGSRKVYDYFDIDDLHVNDINLSLELFADFNEKDILLDINHFSAKPNLNGFRLINLSGTFLIEGNNAGVKNLSIETNRSAIMLNAAMENFDVLGGNNKIEKAPMKVELHAGHFNFDDLTNFIPATGILKGTVQTNLKAKGTLERLTVEDLDVAFNETRLKGKGKLKNVTAGGDMLMDMKFSDVRINQNDVNNLLHTIDLPVYEDYGLIEFDTLFAVGTPLNFHAGMFVKTARGDFSAVTDLDLTGEDIVYDIYFKSYGLDLYPVSGIRTDLYSDITFKGVGFSPESMNSKVVFNANGSVISKRNYQQLYFSLDALNGSINLNLNFKADTTSGKINGNINFADADKPVYSIESNLYSFNLADLLESPGWESDLNISLSAEGESFDPDSINLFAVIKVDTSTFKDIPLDNRRVIIDLRSNDNGEKVINLISNLADITVIGNYSVADLGSLISIETDLISEFIEDRLSQVESYVKNEEEPEQFVLNDKDVTINYAIEFKDFAMLSLLLNNADIEVDGDVNGTIKKTGQKVSSSIDFNLNYFRFWDGANLYYVSGMNLNSDISNDFTEPIPKGFHSKINFEAEQLFVNNKFHNLAADIHLNKGNMELKFYGELEDYLTINLLGKLNIAPNEAALSLDTLFVKYNNFELINKDIVNITYTDSEFHFNKFTLEHEPGEIDVTGFFSLNGNENLTLHIDNMKGKDISTKIFGIPEEASVNSDINLTAFWQGTADNPTLNVGLTLDSISIRKLNIGALTSSFNYDSEQLRLSIDFLDTLYNIRQPKLKVNGTLPVDLSIAGEKKSLAEKSIDIKLLANKFDLVMLENIVPYVRKVEGNLSSDLTIGGKYNDVEIYGDLKVHNAAATVTVNNLRYDTGVSVNFEKNKIKVDTLWVQNESGTKNGGKIIGWGMLEHKNFVFNDIALYMNGKLKILGLETKAVNPNIYGNLVIQTDGNASYIKNRERNEVIADLIIKKGASLTFLPAQSSFSGESEEFKYVYKDYSKKEDAIIDSLILLTHLQSRNKDLESASSNPVDIKLKVRVEDEAKMLFVLSQEFQQNLTAYLGGNFEYDLIDDKPVAKGELKLLEGSKLEFIKPFQAFGSVKFLSEIDDPYLDVTAVYRDYYISSDTTNIAGNEKEVEIRIHLEGPVSQIDKNFMQKEENISVYVRDSGIGDFQLDATKTPSDAIMFIIVGKFTDDATAQDRNLAASTAAAFAGSLVGSFLNQTFGDYIRSVRIQKVGTETVFSLIGKAGPFRYEIGGTSQVFQDLTRANIKIEFPPIESLKSLVFRLERKEPVQNTSSYNEMVNELGIRYRFDF